MDPLVSCIILNFNGGEPVLKAIESILRGNYKNIEMLVVDNASADGSLELIRSKFPNVRVIANEENVGYARGMNIGAEKAKGDLLLFCNNDIRLDQLCLRFLVDVILMDKMNAIAGGRLINDDGSWQTDTGRLVPFFYKVSLVSNNIRCVDYIPGTLMLAKKTTFSKLGGFDESYFMYSEDVDLCWRARRAGFRVIFNPFAKAFHIGSRSAKRLSSSSISYLRQIQEINRYKTLFKNAPAWFLISSLCWLHLTLGSRWTLTAIKGNELNPGIRAYVWMVSNLNSLMKMRGSAKIRDEVQGPREITP
ncbi:MAG: glycosyltransferase family 2 protein [Nitrososphaerales archaeon]